MDLSTRGGKEVHKMSEEIKITEIDLSDLYHYDIQITAAHMLDEILSKYDNIKKILMINFSPDAGMEVYYSDLDRETEKQIIDEIEREEKLDDKFFIEIAKKISAEHVIYLLDGYEWAVAFVKSKEEDP
jgi:hypothetical protein